MVGSDGRALTVTLDPSATAGGVPEGRLEGPGRAPVGLRAALTAPDWPAAERWSLQLRALPSDALRWRGYALVWLTLAAEGGDEDLRWEAEYSALLTRQGDVLWVGQLGGRTTELDACTLQETATTRIEGDALVVTRARTAEWQDPAEEENSQTPSFTALKATCKGTAPAEARYALTPPAKRAQ